HRARRGRRRRRAPAGDRAGGRTRAAEAARSPIPTRRYRMSQVPFIPARRRILSAAAGSAVLGTGWVGSALAQAKEFKVGFFIAQSGPASLFGPTQKACADLAAEK